MGGKKCNSVSYHYHFKMCEVTEWCTFSVFVHIIPFDILNRKKNVLCYFKRVIKYAITENIMELKLVWLWKQTFQFKIYGGFAICSWLLTIFCKIKKTKYKWLWTWLEVKYFFSSTITDHICVVNFSAHFKKLSEPKVKFVLNFVFSILFNL